MDLSPRGLAATLLVGILALGATAASSGGDGGGSDEGGVRDVTDLPIEVLEEELPRTAEEAGLDYAPRLVKVFPRGEAAHQALVSSGLDVTEHAGHGFVEVVLHSQADQDLLDGQGHRYEVVIADMVAREAERILADARFSAAAAGDELPSGRTSYRVLQDFLDEIDQLVADNPRIARKLVIGQSVEGRDIVGIEIAKDVEADDGRPVFLQFGNHHAREWPSATIPMEFAHDLVERLATGDPRTVDLLTRARAIIVPVSNPDGYDASRTTGDLLDLREVDQGGTVSLLATPGNAYKRKNCRIVDGQTQPPGACAAIPSPGGFGIGIDLNRNYGALWGGPGADDSTPGEEEDGSTGLGTASAVYHGPAPFSEPETQAIRELISTRQVTTLISHHTFSNLLLRPVGVQPTTMHPDGYPIGFAPDECFTTDSGDDLGMQALGEKLTAQTGYTNQFGWELYDTTGTTEDYSYNATGGYGYTFEIGPDEFHPPFEQVIAEYNGTTTAAEAITPSSAPFLTTATGRRCPGDPVEHETVGGGLREALYLALENAADTTTHSVITGDAPAGAEITVTRSGEFPLWNDSGEPEDLQTVQDTVTTSMTVQADGLQSAATGDGLVDFTYHVNPSTRPFVRSRAYYVCEDEDPETGECILPEPDITETGTTQVTGRAVETPPNEHTDHPIEVPAGTDAITLQMSAPTVPADDWDLTLISPDLVPLGSSATASSDEFIRFYRPTGIQAGEYVARVTNFSAAGDYQVDVQLGTVPDEFDFEYAFTPSSTEQWALTCSVDGEELDSTKVTVERGESADVGELCLTAASNEGPAAAPDPGGDDLAG